MLKGLLNFAAHTVFLFSFTSRLVAAWGVLTICGVDLFADENGAMVSSPPVVTHPSSISSLRLIGTARLPVEPRTTVENAPVGGLSGLDYDPANNEWWSISDDRSEHAPARAYTFHLEYDEHHVGGIVFTGVHFMRQPDGTLYPDGQHAKKPSDQVPDCEAVRLDPRDRSIWYTSEGDWKRHTSPWVRRADRTGAFLEEISLPSEFAFGRNEKTGPRDNLSFEGISFSPQSDTWWLGMEAPFIEDGPISDWQHGAWVRITQLSRKGEELRQVAYPVERAYLATSATQRADNGLSELLALSDDRLLVLERAGVEQPDGHWHYSALLFEVELGEATDVRGRNIKSHEGVKPAMKHLLADLPKIISGPVDNLEGLSWGHRLSNGHDTLLIISDDNFDDHQVTECHVFEVIGP